MAELGFIGIGTMGKHMVARLLQAGHKVTVWNRNPEKLQGVVEQGARAAGGPAAVAAAADVVFTCVSNGELVDALLTGPEGCLGAARPGALFVDHSTIGVADCQRIHARCAAQGVGFLDAPVSGGPWGAEAGTLAIMVGGNQGDFERALPLLQHEGKNIQYMGASGAGAVTKLCNQLLVGVHTAAMAEAWVLAVKAGVDPLKLLSVISSATGNSAQIQRNLAKFVLPGNFAPAFSLDFLHKDVVLANALARDLQVPMLLTAITEQWLTEAQSLGLGAQDYTAMIRRLEAAAGAEVRAEVPPG